jgi:hypothetical protein
VVGRLVERPDLFCPRNAAQKPTTFVKNDLSAFALVHAYISDALFKFRTSSFACTSKNPFPIGPHKRHRFALWTCAILYPAPTADIRDVRQGSKRPFMTILRLHQTVKQPTPSFDHDTWIPTRSQTRFVTSSFGQPPENGRRSFTRRGSKAKAVPPTFRVRKRAAGPSDEDSAGLDQPPGNG